MQPREWLMLVLLIAIPLAIAVVVTLWSIKQMAYTPKKPVRPKPVLSAADLERLASAEDDAGSGNPGGSGDSATPTASGRSVGAGQDGGGTGRIATGGGRGSV